MHVQTQKKKQFVDLTDQIDAFVHDKAIKHGLCTIFIKHTTAALITCDLDPGVDYDMLSAFEEIVPKLDYHHPHNPSHMPDHIMATILGASLTVPITNGNLDLGPWQRIMLVELDGPRQREVVIRFLKAED